MNNKKQNKKHGREPGKQQNETPNWQPLSMIPTIASIIDGEVENFENLYKNLCEARKKPHVMDDMTMNQAITNHRKYLKEAWVYDEQVRHEVVSMIVIV